ncbi:MAG: hypothetical protein J3Q66DRAFT_140591 [Benniella sp.]|nr:MAG: hypothetical protein J3Q66DRAFT_140591 [Benniella sp.]
MGNCTSLSIEDALNIVDDYLKANDCDSAATALAQVEENSERALKEGLKKRIASTYHDLGNLQKRLARPQNEVDSSFELAKKWGFNDTEETTQALSSHTTTSGPSEREDNGSPNTVPIPPEERPSTGTTLPATDTLAMEDALHEPNIEMDIKNQSPHQKPQDAEPNQCLQEVASQELTSSILSNHGQDGPGTETRVGELKTDRLTYHGHVESTPLQAKPRLGAADDPERLLTEMVEEFLRDPQKKVFLLTGAPGAGKSAFCRSLELRLWHKYESEEDRIPLFINLPNINEPQDDMIAKRLRDVGFTDPQIRELKQYRKFVLICDGYDKNIHSKNLYTSNRLNQPKEWKAQMVISCCSSHLEDNYLNRFHPGDPETDPSLFQEAAIISFASGQQSQ